MKLELNHLTPYLPYGLMVNVNDSDLGIEDFTGEISSWEYYNTRFNVWSEYELESHKVSIESIKPILRPIHAITEEEALQLLDLCAAVKCYDVRINKCSPDISISGSTGKYEFVVFINHKKTHAKIHRKGCVRGVSLAYDVYEWLFKNHFDVFGLIDKGLALEKQSKS